MPRRMMPREVRPNVSERTRSRCAITATFGSLAPFRRGIPVAQGDRRLVVIWRAVRAVVVNIGVIILRRAKPDLERGFRVPVRPGLPDHRHDPVPLPHVLPLGARVRGRLLAGLVICFTYGSGTRASARAGSSTERSCPGGRSFRASARQAAAGGCSAEESHVPVHRGCRARLTLGCSCGVLASAADSVDQRPAQDRREVGAGDRAYVEGFQDGRFYANGWHITGEMGGVWTPPLKLLDGVWFGLDDQWVGQARRFSSGYGYTRFDLPTTSGLQLQRSDFAPDAHRAALFGLQMTNPGTHKRKVTVQVDAHSELMTAYPWGSTTPRRGRQPPRPGRVHRPALQFTDDGARRRAAGAGASLRSAGRRRPDARPGAGRRLGRCVPWPAGQTRLCDWRSDVAAERVRRRPVRPRHRRRAALPRDRPRRRHQGIVGRGGGLRPGPGAGAAVAGRCAAGSGRGAGGQDRRPRAASRAGRA